MKYFGFNDVFSTVPRYLKTGKIQKKLPGTMNGKGLKYTFYIMLFEKKYLKFFIKWIFSSLQIFFF